MKTPNFVAQEQVDIRFSTPDLQDDFFQFFNMRSGEMSYVYLAARKLENAGKVGDSECVALIRHFTKAPATRLWKAGESVIGNKTLSTGTAIATFVDGKWPNKHTGNHAAFYLGQVSNGIYVMDQWNRADKKTISSRFIYRLGKNKDGSYIRPSDNADAFSVIE